MSKISSLADILSAKEKRFIRQKNLLSLFKTNLISFTLNLPGPNKTLLWADEVWQEGLKELNNLNLNIIYSEIRYFKTGAEAVLLIIGEPNGLKRALLALEENHPLGRLWDFDLILPDGVNLSRHDLGLHERSCFLCSLPWRVCRRQKNHSFEELSLKVKNIVDLWQGGVI